MKTLGELNARWYWRLIKVVYFLILTVAVFFAFGGSYYYVGTYPQKDMIAMSEDIDSLYEILKNSKDSVDSLNGVYSSGSIWKLSKDGKLSPAIFKTIFYLNKDAEIEGVELVCSNSNIRCPVSSPTVFSYGEYMRTGKRVEIPYDDVRVSGTLYDSVFSMKELLDKYNHGINYHLGYSIVSKYNDDFGGKISIYDDDHRGTKEYLVMAGLCLIALLCAGILTLFIRGVLYYVVLGSAFPKE